MGKRVINSGLNDRQLRFVEEYLIDLDAGKAAVRAGYSEKGAAVAGSRLLSHVKVAAAVAEEQKKRSVRTGITADRVVTELARIAFASIGDMMEWGPDGPKVKPSCKLTPEQMAAVFEVVVTTGKDIITVRVRLLDKLNALSQLARHTGLCNTAAEQEPSGDIDPCEELERRLQEISERLSVESGTKADNRPVASILSQP